MRLEGGCLCGAVRYVATGQPRNVRICHCRLCQRAIGAAFNVRALYSADAVTITGEVGRFRSSPELVRGFCPQCGTTLFAERNNARVLGLTLGSMDDPDACPPPIDQVWTSRKQAWVKCNDDLPQYAQGAPA